MEHEEKTNEAMFLQLVMGLQSSAWMMLGKIKNPITGKIDVDIDGAKASINTLLMLKEKTTGNLSNTEETYLSNAIQQLQLNFIDESSKSDASKNDKNESAKKQ